MMIDAFAPRSVARPILNLERFLHLGARKEIIGNVDHAGTEPSTFAIVLLFSWQTYMHNALPLPLPNEEFDPPRFPGLYRGRGGCIATTTRPTTVDLF